MIRVYFLKNHAPCSLNMADLFCVRLLVCVLPQLKVQLTDDCKLAISLHGCLSPC